MQIGSYLHLLHRSQVDLAEAFRDVAEHHRDEADVHQIATTFAGQCDSHADRLVPIEQRYRQAGTEELPERLHSQIFEGTREGGLALLRDLQDLYLMASECDIVWTLIGQAAQGLRDDEMLGVVHDCEGETAMQLRWLASRMKQAAPQALVVA
jgi:hypothetical protein